ncbi:MAG: hypothetical protein J6T99_00805 [Oscillospiraceae bacterium]|nr:hypothetical protein [Oscillospiraceae bacterium]
MRILTKEEYKKLFPSTRGVNMGGKRISELMAFHSAGAKYGELQRFCDKIEIDRNAYNVALRNLVNQKVILPDTLKIHASSKSKACTVENIRVQEE